MRLPAAGDVEEFWGRQAGVEDQILRNDAARNEIRRLRGLVEQAREAVERKSWVWGRGWFWGEGGKGGECRKKKYKETIRMGFFLQRMKARDDIT